MTTPTPSRPTGNPGRRRPALFAGIAALTVLGVVLIVLGFLGVGAVRAAAPISSAAARAPVEVPAVPGSTPASPAGLLASPAVHIDIPAIGVHSPVNAVGLNPDRSVQVPAPGPLYDQAAWYSGSAAPGRPGPSVILGHIDSAANGPSVFYRLSRLQPRDEFTVTRSDDRAVTYEVDSVRQYPKDAFPSQEVYGPTTRPEMRLITCGGPFDSGARSYLNNTVVYADQIGPPSTP